jgi:phosphopantetheine--protein transferase-like protein
MYIPKMREIANNPVLLEKFFHQSELKNKDFGHLCGIIAAKEAFFKALNQFPKFKHIEVKYGQSGRPKIVVSPEFKDYKKSDVSISHDHNYAIAMVVIEK